MFLPRTRSIMMNLIRRFIRSTAVSYTHLDVYKRQLYRALFSSININIFKLSEFVDGLHDMQFASCQELISYICETLNVVWDVPSIVSTKYVPKVNNLSSGRLSSAKIITSAIGFINRADDIPSAYALKKLKEKFAKFATDKDINCTAPFPSDTPLFPNYNDFEECVINFVCGMDLKANRAKLLAVDYAIIDQIIGTKLPAKTSEKAPVVTGAPMDAYSQIFLDIANRFHIAYGSYQMCIRDSIIAVLLLFQFQHKSPDTHHDQEDTQQKENHPPVSPAVAVGIPRTGGVAEPVPVADRSDQNHCTDDYRGNIPMLL